LHFVSANFSRRRSSKTNISYREHNNDIALKSIAVGSGSSFLINADSLPRTFSISNVKRGYDKEMEDWLPEYKEMQESIEQPLSYKELAAYMNNVISNKHNSHDYIIGWKKNMLSFANPLGSVIGSFTTHFLDKKHKVSQNLIQSYSIASDIVLKISMKELQRMKEERNTVQEILQIKKFERLRDFTEKPYCSISLFNHFLQ